MADAGAPSEWSAVANAAGDLVFRTNSSGSILEFVANRPELLYLPPESFLNRPWHDLLPPDVAEKFDSSIRDAMHTGKLQTIVYSLPVGNGPIDDRWFEARIHRLNATDTIVVIRDVTTHREAEQLLRRQNRMLSTIAKVLSKAISHDGSGGVYEELLSEIVNQSGSEFGFVASIESPDQISAIDGGMPQVDITSISGANWLKPDSRSSEDGGRPTEASTRAVVNRLIDDVVQSRQIMIRNDFSLSKHPGSGDDARNNVNDRCPLKTLMLMPVVHGDLVVGIVGVGNRNGGYCDSDAAFLSPLLSAYGHSLRAFQSEVQRRESETRLRESEERFQFSVKGSNDGLWDWDFSRKVTWWSTRLYALVGYDDRAIPAGHSTLRRHLHPEDRARVLNRVLECLRIGQPYRDEFRLRTKSGEYRWFHARGVSIVNDNHRAIRFAGTLQDVTERVLAEQALRAVRDELEQRVDERTAELKAINERLTNEVLERRRIGEERERLVSMIEQTTDYIGLILPNVGVRYLNRSFREAFGIDAENLASVNFRHILSVASQEMYVNEILPRLRADGVWSGEIAAVSRDFREIPLLVLMQLHDDDSRGEKLISLIGRDVSDRRRVEQLQEELGHVNRVSTANAMASALAHELNQPLGAIANDAQACLRGLREGRLDPNEIREALEGIVSGAIRGGEIIRRIRSFVSKRSQSKQPTQLNELVREVAKMMQSELHRNKIGLLLDMADDLPNVLLDRIQIEQVLVNLIRNGIDAVNQYASPLRRIVITTRRMFDEIRISVSDSGLPAGTEFPPRAFEPYFTTKSNGLGMGLSISRGIVEHYDGRIDVMPNEPRGVTMQISFPVPSGLPSMKHEIVPTRSSRNTKGKS